MATRLARLPNTLILYTQLWTTMEQGKCEEGAELEALDNVHDIPCALFICLYELGLRTGRKNIVIVQPSMRHELTAP